MAILSRVGRLFKADFHAVIDQLEEPLMLLKQSVREMDEALQQDKDQLNALKKQREIYAQRLQAQDESLAQIEEELDVCFIADNEDLARVLIKRKLEAQQLKKAFSGKLSSLQDEVGHLHRCIEERTPQLDAMRQKLALLSEDMPNEARSDEKAWPSITICEADVEVALLREKQQRSGK